MSGRSLEKLSAAKSEIEASSNKGQISIVQLDVTDSDSVAKAVSYVEQHFGHLDALVNNAGIATTDLRAVHDVNVIGPSVVAAAFRPLLLKSQAQPRTPYSIYVSSSVGSLALASDPSTPWFGEAGSVAYRSSKAALNMVVIQDWKEARGTALKVFAICPGFVESNLRGTSEEQRTGGGTAGDPMVSGQLILSIIEGKRDQDEGKLIHKDGVYPW